MPSRVLSPELEQFAFEKLTVGATVKSLTAATAFPQTGVNCRGARGAYITVEANTIHYREDGVDPDATTGLTAIAGAEIVLMDSNAIKNFRAIRASADAVIQVGYYR